jgi:hypothetical protein
MHPPIFQLTTLHWPRNIDTKAWNFCTVFCLHAKITQTVCRQEIRFIRRPLEANGWTIHGCDLADSLAIL